MRQNLKTDLKMRGKPAKSTLKCIFKLTAGPGKLPFAFRMVPGPGRELGFQVGVGVRPRCKLLSNDESRRLAAASDGSR